MRGKWVLALVCALLVVPAATADAATTVLVGERGGAPYRIVVPENWNGTLLVYAHGYVDKADHPGEVDNRTPAAAPGGPAMEAALAGMGYALAGSAYADNGWAVKEGIHDTRSLTTFFGDVVGAPTTTLLWGFSMGSLVATNEAEHASGIYDGVLPACAVDAGSPRAWDGGLAHLLAYKVAFGMPAAWGTPGDVRDDLDFNTEVLSKLLADTGDPRFFGKTEFIRLVTQVAGPWPSAPPIGWLPGGYFTNMFFLTEARAELERRAGGHPVQNLTHTYALPDAAKAYLASLGVNADALLAAMNGEDYAAEPNARNYLRSYDNPTGKLQVPTLTLHTKTDTLVPPQHESAYRETVADAGRSALLQQAFTNGNGHCNFTGTQLIDAITGLESWVKTGTPPTFSPADGFDPAYTPAPWPQP